LEQVDVEKLIGELEIAVDRLRSLYDQYFVGLEKIEPAVPRKDVDRRVYALRKEQIRNTALRFRFQTVLQRYNTYQTHWQRICREIENGTYKRHLIRAQRRFGSSRPAPSRSVPPPPLIIEPGRSLPADLAAKVGADPAQGLAVDVQLDDETPAAKPAVPAAQAVPQSLPDRLRPPALRPVPPVWKKVASSAPAVVDGAPPEPTRAAAPAPPRPPPPRPGAPPLAAVEGGDLPEERLRELYSEYVGAKRSQNESTATLTYQALAKSLRESGERLRKKHGKPVDFEVVIRDGKPMLRPVLK
jgi:hypothetical protein